MAEPPHLDGIFQEWPYDPNAISVRIVPGHDGRDVIQLRLDMGLLQLETAGRPDGEKPEGADTYYSYLAARVQQLGEEYELTEEECEAADREFLQFHRRRICWIALREYRRAVEDADHTLRLMDLCRDHSPDDEWTISHEQSRTYVLFHRTQASALAELEESHEKSKGPEGAVQELNQGLDRIREVFVSYDAEEEFDEDELVQRLVELRESLREQYAIGRTLAEQLEDAIKAEKYELAARLRDEIRKEDRRRKR